MARRMLAVPCRCEGEAKAVRLARIAGQRDEAGAARGWRGARLARRGEAGAPRGWPRGWHTRLAQREGWRGARLARREGWRGASEWRGARTTRREDGAARGAWRGQEAGVAQVHGGGRGWRARGRRRGWRGARLARREARARHAAAVARGWRGARLPCGTWLARQGCGAVRLARGLSRRKGGAAGAEPASGASKRSERLGNRQRDSS